MKTTRSVANYLVLSIAALLLAACANQMQPARKAIDDITSAVATATADADKYIQCRGERPAQAGGSECFL